VGGREKVVFHGVANVRPTTSKGTSVTPKICCGPDTNPFCLLRNLSVEEKRCLMKWLSDFE